MKKKENFFKAYDNFEVSKVAKYNEKKIEKLLNDAGIIRNRLKITAAIENAKKILELQKEFGSFKKWLDKHHPLTKDEWVKLFKQNFRFTGGEIVNEFFAQAINGIEEVARKKGFYILLYRTDDVFEKEVQAE